MPRRDVSLSREEVDSFMNAARTGVLSTLGPDGWPHLTAMWFLPTDGKIQMWTYRRSQKARNLARDPRAALLVEDGTEYSELRGVQVRGRVSLIEDVEPVAAIGRGLYLRYSNVEGDEIPEAIRREIERQAHKRVGLVLGVERLTSWDHRKLAAN